jgi:hypothetical protein
MKLAIIGASGKTGIHLVRESLRRGRKWGRCCFFALLLYKQGLDMGMLFTIQVLRLDDEGHGPCK